MTGGRCCTCIVVLCSGVGKEVFPFVCDTIHNTSRLCIHTYLVLAQKDQLQFSLVRNIATF